MAVRFSGTIQPFSRTGSHRPASPHRTHPAPDAALRIPPPRLSRTPLASSQPSPGRPGPGTPSAPEVGTSPPRVCLIPDQPQQLPRTGPLRSESVPNQRQSSERTGFTARPLFTSSPDTVRTTRRPIRTGLHKPTHVHLNRSRPDPASSASTRPGRNQPTSAPVATKRPAITPFIPRPAGIDHQFICEHSHDPTSVPYNRLPTDSGAHGAIRTDLYRRASARVPSRADGSVSRRPRVGRRVAPTTASSPGRRAGQQIAHGRTTTQDSPSAIFFSSLLISSYLSSDLLIALSTPSFFSSPFPIIPFVNPFAGQNRAAARRSEPPPTVPTALILTFMAGTDPARSVAARRGKGLAAPSRVPGPIRAACSAQRPSPRSIARR